ncbi:MAG: carboxylesterase family protein [Pseudomonadota bacterium]
MGRQRIVRLLIACALAASAACSKSSDASKTSDVSEPPKPPIIEAAGETLLGAVEANGVYAFKGVPYAAAPNGERRWRAPITATPREGHQDARAFGAACPQDNGNSEWYQSVAKGVGADPRLAPQLTDISENCLFLNIWTPSLNADAALPVMVWVHGGSNVNGYGHEPNYHGAALAQKGVVVVSLNYRLGPLGFLAHPALSDDGPNGVSGYYGLLDQIAALHWVADNIAAFGGDKDSVTVFGESAGGGDIAALMHMADADGLFHRAIIQSGAIGPGDPVAYADANAAGVALMAALEAETIDEMRALDWRDIIQTRPQALPDYYFGPVADGRYLSADANLRPVPLLIGSNRDEWLMYLPEEADAIEAAYEDALTAYAADRDGLHAYLSDQFDTPAARADALYSGAEFLCPSLSLAARNTRLGAQSFAYHFTRVRPGADALQAYHGAEIPYAFDTADPWLPGDGVDAALADAITRYWTTFAKTGMPSGDDLSDDLAPWAAYDGEAETIMELGARIGPLKGDPSAICAYLKQ